MKWNAQAKNVSFNLISALILALILEFLVWMGIRNPQFIPGFLTNYYQAYYLSSDRNILQMTECAEYDPHLFYKFKKGPCNFTNREFDVINLTNSAGLRDDEESLHNPSIIVLGDSFTMGWGVEQQNSFPERLELLVNQKVLNAGISSFGTAREVTLMDQLDLKNVNCIVFQYHSNDYPENKTFEENNFRLTIRSKKSYDSLKGEITNRNRYYPFKYVAGLSKSFAHSLFSPDNSDKVNDTIQAKTFLNILQHSAIAKTTPRIIVFKVDKYGRRTDGFVNAIDYLQNTGSYGNMNIKTIRLDGILDESDYFILDDHINKNGHQKIANVLSKIVSEDSKTLIVSDRTTQ